MSLYSESEIDFSKIFNINYDDINANSTDQINKEIPSINQIIDNLKTNIDKGISSTESELEWRRVKFGSNVIPAKGIKTILEHILECLEDNSLRVLLLSAFISLVIGIFKDGWQTGWIEGCTILTSVFIVVSISSYLTYNESLMFQKMSLESKKCKSFVIRDGVETEINSNELLAGDILIIKTGDCIKADGLYIGKNIIKVDESPITGESELKIKTSALKNSDNVRDSINSNNTANTENNDLILENSSPILFSGSFIKEGSGKMIVCAVGTNSFVGRNAELLQSKNDNEEDTTPLQTQLDTLNDQISFLGTLMAIIIGLTIIIRELYLNYRRGEAIVNSVTINVVLNAFILAVAIIVVAIPEGLPMSVIISMAYSLIKMKNENNLVKNIRSSETMGNCDNVCTDKTGTLTKGEMNVCSIWYEEKDYNIQTYNLLVYDKKEQIYNSICNNISAFHSKDVNGNDIIIGDMTEVALKRFIEKNGIKCNRFHDGNEPDFIFPFNHEQKLMISIWKNRDDNDYTLYAKGAFESLKSLIKEVRCSEEYNADLKDYNDKIVNILEQYNSEAKRTIVFAQKTISKLNLDNALKKNKIKDFNFFKEISKDLTLQFIIGIRDTIREDVPEAIEKCKQAGITVRTITGDSLLTALAISKEVGIINDFELKKSKETNSIIKKILEDTDDLNINEEEDESLNDNNILAKKIEKLNPSIFDNIFALEGNTFRKLCGGIKKNNIKDKNAKDKKIEIKYELANEDLFAKVTKNLKVIARASPEDKFILVYGLMKLGKIVAVTGDGSNDAPALRKAHVGFSMGIRGTDLSKESADIILLDDSFKSIVTACKYGRNVYDSIRKFIQFQLTTNIVAVFMSLVGGLVLEDSPLNCIEMLWVNLIMDSLASLALSTDSPKDDLLQRKPYKRGDNILTPNMIYNILTQAIFQIIILSIILFKGDVLFGVPSDRSLEHYEWNEVNGYHFTIFFNVFVFLQVFNSINARKLNPEEINVFTGIFDNIYYIFVQLFIICVQILLVTFGGRAVRTKRLTLKQHFICIAIASLSLVVGFICKGYSLFKKRLFRRKVRSEKSE